MSREIVSRINSAFTKKQLLEELEFIDDDALVLFVCDYGDHHHTQQALPVSEAEEMLVRDLSTSAYSHSGVALPDDDPDDEPSEPDDYADQPIVILR